MQENSFGFAHLWASGDSISHAVAIILAIMSVASWYLILAKAVDWWNMRRAARALGAFWSASSVGEGIDHLRQSGSDSAAPARQRSLARRAETGSARAIRQMCDVCR